MPSTHLSLHYHIIFATKNRVPMIDPCWRGRLHAFMGGILNTLDAVPEAIGGVADHVHLLVGLRARHRLSDVVREVKAVSSRWIHDELGTQTFAWQEGYGGFTVSAAERGAVQSYVQSQENHHRVRTFQEEYLDFLKRNKVDYDPQYLW